MNLGALHTMVIELKGPWTNSPQDIKVEVY
jgi:hypothetical protein